MEWAKPLGHKIWRMKVHLISMAHSRTSAKLDVAFQEHSWLSKKPVQKTKMVETVIFRVNVHQGEKCVYGVLQKPRRNCQDYRPTRVFAYWRQWKADQRWGTFYHWESQRTYHHCWRIECSACAYWELNQSCLAFSFKCHGNRRHAEIFNLLYYFEGRAAC